MEPQLRERDTALAHIDELIDAARHGRGGLVCIEAGAGLGKTALARSARGRACGAGFTVLWAGGIGMERQLGFGVVRRLFRGVLADLDAIRRSELFSGVAGLASPVLLDDGAGPVSPDAAFAGFHGLYWLLAELAADMPLLVIIDDAHWVDDPSLSWLNYLAARLDGLAVGVLVTTRTWSSDSPAALLDLSGRSTVIGLEPLSLDGVTRWLTASLGEADDQFVAACHTLTGGSPFLLSELIAELERQHLPPVAASVGTVAALAPGGIARSVLTRLAALGPGAGAVARALTVLGDGAAVRHVASLAGMGVDEATAGAVVLLKEDIVDAQPALSFTHPLLGAAVTSTVSVLERAVLHARAARILADDGAEPADVAIHLLEAEPAGDRWAVDILRRAGATATARAAPSNAAVLLTRALREPPEPDQRFSVLSELGQAEALARAPDAVAHLRAALAIAPDDHTRAVLSLQLGQLLVVMGALDDAYSLMTNLIDDLQHRARERAAEAACVLSQWCATEVELVDQVPEVMRRARSLTSVGSRSGKTLTALEGFRHATGADNSRRAIAMFAEALGSGHFDGHSALNEPAPALAAMGLVYVDAFDQADALTTRMLTSARQVGSPFFIGTVCCWRALLELHRGRFADSVAASRLALELFAAAELDALRPFALGYLVDALIGQGEIEEADRALTGVELSTPYSSRQLPLWGARARLRLAQGRAEDAVADARHAGAVMAALVLTNPCVEPWRSTAAEALLTLGETDGAGRLVTEELTLARRSGISSAIGRALRISGRVNGGDDGLGLLRSATEELRFSGARGELAFALVDLGCAERRAARIREAREHLRQGLDLASRCGAPALAANAIEELRVTGARPRRQQLTGVGALTPSELRTARMATEGLTNREIAQALFVTVKTVEDHLGAAYRKLGIGSRTELAGVLT